MANYSSLTRKEQVLAYLQARANQWVDGQELATEEVGGSEGLRRIRELKSEGFDIRMRQHPDSRRDVWQYKLVTTGAQLAEARSTVAAEDLSDKPVYPRPIYVPPAPKTAITEALKRRADGTYEYVPPHRRPGGQSTLADDRAWTADDTTGPPTASNGQVHAEAHATRLRRDRDLPRVQEQDPLPGGDR